MQIDLTPSLLARFWAKVDKNGPVPAHCPELGPCWLWTAGRIPDGYGSFKVDGRGVLAHRLSWSLANGDIPDETPCVLHRCDNPPCVNPAHLWAGTQGDNSRDREAKGRGAPVAVRMANLPRGDQHWMHLHPEWIARGERSGAKTHPERIRRGSLNGRAKLTEDDVRAIRTRYAEGVESQRVLAVEYGVSSVKISQIALRKSWKHIP